MRNLIRAGVAALAVAVLSGCASGPAKIIHSTNEVYPAIGPYSQIVQAGNLYFLAGVIPLNKAGNAVQGTTIEEQTRLVHLCRVLQVGPAGARHHRGVASAARRAGRDRRHRHQVGGAALRFLQGLARRASPARRAGFFVPRIAARRKD